MDEYVSFITLFGPTTVNTRLIRKFITTKLTNCFYWRHCPGLGLTRDDVLRFLRACVKNSDLPMDFLERIAYYILLYSENTAFSAFLMTLAHDGKDAAKEYMDYIMPCLEELRRLYHTGRSRGFTTMLVRKMLTTCMDYSIDPF